MLNENVGSSTLTWKDCVGNVEPGEVIFVVRREHDPHLVWVRINDVVLSIQKAAMCEQQVVVSILIAVENLQQQLIIGARNEHKR